jgi:hypothetical protein
VHVTRRACNQCVSVNVCAEQLMVNLPYVQVTGTHTEQQDVAMVIKGCADIQHAISTTEHTQQVAQPAPWPAAIASAHLRQAPIWACNPLVYTPYVGFRVFRVLGCNPPTWHREQSAKTTLYQLLITVTLDGWCALPVFFPLCHRRSTT